MKIFRIYILVSAALWYGFLTNPAGASDQIPAPPQSRPIALTGGTIHPVTAPVIETGTILFENGSITGLGKNISIPGNAKVIDVSGKHVYPGLIECSSLLGLVEIDAVGATVDYGEIGLINPNVQAQKAINPDSERFPVTRANGIALAVSKPTGGLISGQAALLMLDGWTWEDMTYKSPVGMMINWPNQYIPTLIDKEERQKREKAVKEQLEAIAEAFRNARAYMKAQEAAEKKTAPYHKKDARWESMIPVLKGDLPVWVDANTLEQIETAVAWADEENIRMVLVGGADSWRAASLLKEKKIPVIVTPIQRLPIRRDSDYDEQFTLADKLYDAGVSFCIAGVSGNGNERNLPYHAAMAAAYGLPKDAALNSITINAAEILGIADKAGSLERGKDATIIVTDGDPLEITTNTLQMFIQGREIDLDNKHKELYKKYREKYRQLGE